MTPGRIGDRKARVSRVFHPPGSVRARGCYEALAVAQHLGDNTGFRLWSGWRCCGYLPMPGFDFAPAWTFLSALGTAPLRPLHTFVRTTEERLRPPRVELHRPAVRRAADALAAPEELGARVLREQGSGRVPTIVLGGFVPDSSEQVFLLRRFLLRSGDLFCLNYPREAFSLDAICAQISDLVDECNERGTPPVIFGVSFGAGIVLEWLRRGRVAGWERKLAGVVLVSPVTCIADILAAGVAKPATLLGRAVLPFLADREVPAAAIEKSRAIFVRMFEAGAQNRKALQLIMSRAEVERLRAAVLGTIRGITAEGARQRVRALREMEEPTAYFRPGLLPLTRAPALVLFAEREEAVLDAGSPAAFAFEHGCRGFFPGGRALRVRGRPYAAPVQHASLIFHVFEFLPALQRFYQGVRSAPLRLAA